MKKLILTLIFCLLLIPCIFLFTACKNNDITITFDSNGGTVVASQKISPNSQVIAPQDPIKEGYIFNGWYKYPYQDWNKVSTFEGMSFNEDTTIKAKCLPIFEISRNTLTGITNAGRTLTEIVIPNSIKVIGERAFYEYEKAIV